MKLLNSFWFVDVGRLLYNGPTISHFFINSRIKRWIDWKKWKRLMGGPLKKVSELMEWNDKPRKKTLFFFAGVSGMESTSEAPSSAHRCAASQRQLQSISLCEGDWWNWRRRELVWPPAAVNSIAPFNKKKFHFICFIAQFHSLLL